MTQSPNPEPMSRPKFLPRPVVWLCLLVLAVNFVIVFKSAGSMIYFKGADEDQWVKNSIHYWQAGVGSPISHTPLFHDVIIPFVGGFLVDTETGYAIWKFFIFFLSHLVVFYVASKVSNVWIGFAITVYIQYTVDPWSSPTYTYLAMVLVLISIALTLYNKKLLGVAVGVLLLGSLVRLELLLFAIVSICLLLLFSRKSVLSMRFAKQLSIPVVLFVGLIYWHGSSLTRFPTDYMFRGQQSVVWYVVDFMYYHGYFAKYTDLGRGDIPLELQDKVLTEYFGKSLEELNKTSFLELYRRNPSIIEARYKEMLQQLPTLLLSPFIIKFPYGDSSMPLLGLWQLALVAIVPTVVLTVIRKRKSANDERARGTPAMIVADGVFAISLPPKEFIFLLFSALAGFAPWLMTYPQAHYIVMALPLALVVLSWSLQILSNGLSYALKFLMLRSSL